MPVSKPVHPKIKYLQQRITDTFSLSVEKAAAHLKDPAKNPLPAGKDNLEFAIVDFLNVLPKRRRDKFLDKLKNDLAASGAARRQKYGELAAVDFGSTRSIAEQAMAIPVKKEMLIGEKDIPGIQIPVKPAAKDKQKKVANERQPRQAVPGTAVLFSIDKITCIETTDRRKDEVTVSAFGVSGTGEVFESNDFFIADFKKNETKSPGEAGTLFKFGVDSSVNVFPLSLSAGVFIVEKDPLSNAKKSEKIGSILRLTAKLLTPVAIGAFFIPGIGIPLGSVLSGSVILMIGIGEFLQFVAGDDFSETVIDELLLETPPFAGEVFPRTLEIGFVSGGFRLKGKYSVSTRWEVG